MKFDEAIKELEIAKKIKSSSTLIWCPIYSDSKWDYKALDYLLKNRKDFDEKWIWNTWSPDYEILDLHLSMKFIKLFNEFCYLNSFVSAYNEIFTEEKQDSYYGSFHLGNVKIRVFFKEPS